jgi:hypothetical protein
MPFDILMVSLVFISCKINKALDFEKFNTTKQCLNFVYLLLFVLISLLEKKKFKLRVNIIQTPFKLLVRHVLFELIR